MLKGIFTDGEKKSKITILTNIYDQSLPEIITHLLEKHPRLSETEKD
jgi:hypothetical protein